VENYSLAPQAEVERVARPGVLLKNVYRLYRNQFWRWFGITAPTSLVAAVVLLLVSQAIGVMFSSIPRNDLTYHWGVIAGAMALRFGGFFLDWLLGCFALGAIATLVSGLQNGDDEGVWKPDSHQRTREHLGAIALAALITFGTFLAGMVVMQIVLTAAIRAVGWSHFSRFHYGVSVAGYLLVASIVSWLGAAVPLILQGNIGVLVALKRSMGLSNGYEGVLFLLVVKSVVGSYVAVYAIYYGARFLPPAIKQIPLYGWILTAIAILATAALEPPLFIGLSLLADPERFREPSTFPSAQYTA
jgi:hypothetical protein